MRPAPIDPNYDPGPWAYAGAFVLYALLIVLLVVWLRRAWQFIYWGYRAAHKVHQLDRQGELHRMARRQRGVMW